MGVSSSSSNRIMNSPAASTSPQVILIVDPSEAQNLYTTFPAPESIYLNPLIFSIITRSLSPSPSISTSINKGESVSQL